MIPIFTQDKDTNRMTGIALVITLAVAIIIMVLAIVKWKIHPFLAMIGIAILLAIAAGLPLAQIPDIIGKGFASIFTSIGLVIIFGMLIGLILEKTGAAVSLADGVVRLVGPRHPRLALLMIGWIVSIPVFCDSGFVIINPIRKTLAKKTGAPSVGLTLALAAGLYSAHVFMPPTPGPIAAAGMLGISDHLLTVILVGTIVSIPALIAAYFFAGWRGSKVTSREEDNVTTEDYEQIIKSFGKLPSLFESLMPIILPIILMAGGSIISVFDAPEGVANILTFLGKPIISLIAGFLCATVLLFKSGRIGEIHEITEETLKTGGPIIFITAAGAALGNVIMQTGIINFISENASVLSFAGVFFPFLIAAILKTAIGSSTVAITTTASLMGLYNSSESMMALLGMTTPLHAALVVMAIGAGAMTVSHANDSFFWVVTNFGGIKPQDSFKTQTALTLVMGLASIISIFVITLFI